MNNQDALDRFRQTVADAFMQLEIDLGTRPANEAAYRSERQATSDVSSGASSRASEARLFVASDCSNAWCRGDNYTSGVFIVRREWVTIVLELCLKVPKLCRGAPRPYAKPNDSQSRQTARSSTATSQLAATCPSAVPSIVIIIIDYPIAVPFGWRGQTQAREVRRRVRTWRLVDGDLPYEITALRGTFRIGLDSYSSGDTFSFLQPWDRAHRFQGRTQQFH